MDKLADAIKTVAIYGVGVLMVAIAYLSILPGLLKEVITNR